MRPRILEHDRETSAILVNRSQNGIAAIQQVWTFQETNGRTHPASIASGSAFFCPFGVPEKALRLRGYWHVILPGSARYLNADGELVGDNSDVRPPAPDEVWTGGVISTRTAGNRRRRPMEKVTLTLDGVFFTNGGFAGPNREGLWERTVCDFEAHMQVAGISRQGYMDGTPAQKILSEIASITGPPGEHHSIHNLARGAHNAELHRNYALGMVARQIEMARKTQGDEWTLSMLMARGDARAPQFHKL
jgi:hypothetical protein